MFKHLRRIFCKHDFVFVRKLYGDEINEHSGRRDEYICKKCGAYKWK